jgi:predicted permease
MPNEARPQNTSDMHMALRYVVGPEYRKAMGTPLLRGRFFSESDTEDKPGVAVIDEVFARKYFGTEDPLGLPLHLADNPNRTVTVVGITRHVVQWGLDTDFSHPLRSEIYLPISQLPGEQLISTTGFDIDMVIRAANPSEAFAGVQKAVRRMDPATAVYAPETMQQIVDRSLASWRFSMILLGVFAGLAMLLAAVGLYSVISYVTSLRMREVAIRMALGADRQTVLRSVLGQAGTLAVYGVAIGVAGVLILSRFMSAVIFGVSSRDPWTLANVAAILLAVALVSAFVPARRAATVDPMQALRSE